MQQYSLIRIFVSRNLLRRLDRVDLGRPAPYRLSISILFIDM